jgi:hypothetical protein
MSPTTTYLRLADFGLDRFRRGIRRPLPSSYTFCSVGKAFYDMIHDRRIRVIVHVTTLETQIPLDDGFFTRRRSGNENPRYAV